MATFEFTLPDLGEGVMEGEIVKWLVKAGDVITEDQALVDIMTDKATVTVPSPKKGKVIRTHGKIGEMAKVHKPLVDLEMDAVAGESAPKTVATAAPVAQVSVVAATPMKAVAAAAPLSNSTVISNEKVLATPVTRRMAREHGIDLSTVVGSGPQGRVLKVDVESALSSGGTEKSSAPASGGGRNGFVFNPLIHRDGDQRIPLTGLRKKIAEKMVRSKFTAPHYAFVEEVDATELVAMRERINAKLAKSGDKSKLSFLPFLVKAVLAAFRKFPQVNANMDEATQELIVRADHNIGIAAMTAQGLTVPVVRKANTFTLRTLGDEISRLAVAARDQKLKLEELSAGTFTITSLGQIGGLFATPILNHPEVGIMGVHRMRKRPIVMENDEIVIRQMMLLSFCFDHRVIDGATGAEFAYEVIKYVEQPEMLLMDMA